MDGSDRVYAYGSPDCIYGSGSVFKRVSGVRERRDPNSNQRLDAGGAA